MKKSNKTERHKKAVLEALEKSLGIATTACRMVGIGRTTYYEWLKTDKEFADKVKELENVALDFFRITVAQFDKR
jgi:DNA invertase Pin-like site-specific DNA recombinase